MQRHLLTAGLAIAAGLIAGTANATAEIQWWHAMTGANNDVVNELTKEFNDSQTAYKVTPVFKGSYLETLNAGIAAFRAHQAPTIIQIYDAGTGVMMGAQNAIVPVADVMQKAGANFDKSQYLPGIVSYYSKPDGTMLSFPYNSSSPILYYNKDIFQKAGLDPNRPPLTWPDVWADARQIKASGAASCGYTAARLTWIGLENFAAWNNIPFATDQNGLGSLDPKLEINAPNFVNYFQSIADLGKEGVFKYGGRTSEATFFMNGTCGIYTDSSGGIGDIINSKVNFATGPLPYDPSAPGAPQNTIPGGASLWVFSGHSDDEYKAAAAFFQFLSRTDIQVKLHEQSGYLPVTFAAYNQAKQEGFYAKNPGREQPILQMIGKPPTDNSKGVRLVNLPQVRDIEDTEFEAMLAGKEDAKTALDNAVTKGNAAIDQAAKALGQ
jgi:sn-glycerol 3-phosphate transport system substrate-binding protein